MTWLPQSDGFEILENPAMAPRFQLLDEPLASRPAHSITPRPVSPSQPTPTRADLPAVSGSSDPFRASTGPAPNRSDPSGSRPFQSAAESDSDHQPRFSATEKGKQSVNPCIPMSDSESSDGGDTEMFRESATPTPHAVGQDYSLSDGIFISDAPFDSRTAP